MTNPELIKFLYEVVKTLKKEKHHLADKLDYMVYIVKERLDPT